jgi:ankyrin repeat protein
MTSIASLYFAITKNDWPLVLRLLSKKPSPELTKMVQYVDHEGKTVLHECIGQKKWQPPIKVVKKLLESGLSPNICKKTGESVLFVAAENNVDVEIIKLLCSFGGNPNLKRESDGITPLFVAVQNNASPDLVDILIQNGGDVNTLNNNESSILHIACMSKADVRLVEVLLKRGANPSFTNNQEGLTPLVLAIQHGCSPSIIRILLEFGADPNYLVLGQFTALDKAFSIGNPEIIEILSNPPKPTRILDKNHNVTSIGTKAAAPSSTTTTTTTTTTNGTSTSHPIDTTTTTTTNPVQPPSLQRDISQDQWNFSRKPPLVWDLYGEEWNYEYT